MSQRDSHPLEKVVANVQRECEKAVADSKDAEIVECFHTWVAVAHERCEQELDLLKSRRRCLHYLILGLPDPDTFEEWFSVCSAIGHAEENYLLLNDYIQEVRENNTGILDTSNHAGLVLWHQYRDMLQKAAKTELAAPVPPPPSVLP